MVRDADPKEPDPKHRAAGTSAAGDNGPSMRGIPPTTIGLCGLGMIVVGSGMRRAVTEGWWVWLALAVVLLFILAMAMVQERWLTLMHHRLIESARKWTGELSGSAPAKPKKRRGTGTRGGGKPVENPASGGDQNQPALPGDGGAPPDPRHAPEREAVGEEAASREERLGEERAPEDTDTGAR